MVPKGLYGSGAVCRHRQQTTHNCRSRLTATGQKLTLEVKTSSRSATVVFNVDLGAMAVKTQAFDKASL
jgi:hypothetical protein